MKVMLINGSPKEKGNTYLVLEEFASALKTYEIDSEIFQIGKDPISPCMGCGACAKLSKCVIDDKVNEFNRKMKDSDALVAASPVHYACATGSLLNFMARAFSVINLPQLLRLQEGREQQPRLIK